MLRKNTVINYFVMLLLISIVFTSVFSVAVKAETLKENTKTGKTAELAEIIDETEVSKPEPIESVESEVLLGEVTSDSETFLTENTLSTEKSTSEDIAEGQDSTTEKIAVQEQQKSASEESTTAESDKNAQFDGISDLPKLSGRAIPSQVTRYIYANSIIRSTPNGSIITTLKMPLFVTGTIQGAWLKFTYNGATAYVANSVTTTNNPPITGYAKSAVNVRNAPGGSVIGTIPLGHEVRGVLIGNMARLTYNDQVGYVYVSMLQATPVQVTRYIYANSIIRSAPNGEEITTLWRPLLIKGKREGAWIKFNYDGSTAYVAAGVTTTNNPPISGYINRTVNVRKTPGGIITHIIPIGFQVQGVLVGNTIKIHYNNETGYVDASFLQRNTVYMPRYVAANSIIRTKPKPKGSIIEISEQAFLAEHGYIKDKWFHFTYQKGYLAYSACVELSSTAPTLSHQHNWRSVYKKEKISDGYFKDTIIMALDVSDPEYGNGETLPVGVQEYGGIAYFFATGYIAKDREDLDVYTDYCFANDISTQHGNYVPSIEWDGVRDKPTIPWTIYVKEPQYLESIDYVCECGAIK